VSSAIVVVIEGDTIVVLLVFTSEAEVSIGCVVLTPE
jgi:hypothetical protein